MKRILLSERIKKSAVVFDDRTLPEKTGSSSLKSP